MAINVYEKLSEKNAPKSSCSKSSNLSSCLMKLDYTADESTTSSRNDILRNKRSPYLKGDKVQMHSRVTERKLVRTKTDFVSSFPLAVNIYKASSDDFKVLKRGNKKIKKSVLTLPNNPAPVPQNCTVSDLNDSQYFNENKNERKPRPRKKRTIQNDKKHRKSKKVDVYDRDARYCSQLDIDLDSSSTDFINQFTGDGKKQTRRKVPANKTEIRAHDVWAILRNLNQFQFVPSPPMSQDSIISRKKRLNLNKIRSRCRDARVIETCRTEEFAYISNFVDNCHSQSSIDRVTVIDKQDNYQEICKKFENNVDNSKSKMYRSIQNKTKPKTTRKQNLKANNSNNIGSNSLQANLEQLTNNCINEKDQRNEIVGLTIKSGNQKPKRQRNNDDMHFCPDFTSSPTNTIDKTNMYNTQDENKLHNNKLKIQINGITKVVLSKGNNIENKGTETLNKSCDLASLSVSTLVPKLTPHEAQTLVSNDNQPHRLKRGKLTNYSNLRTVNNGDIKPNKLKQCPTNAPSIRNKPNNDPKFMFEDNVFVEVEPEFKQKRQLKDKMLQFLYKKHQDDNTQELITTQARNTVKKPVEVGTNTEINIALLKDTNESKVDVTKIINASPTSKGTWTKGKWASEFIDSVIKKIRSGVYHNNEKIPYRGNYKKREDSSQTDINIEDTSNHMIYPKYTRPQFLTIGEELFKTFPAHNSSKFKRESFNSSQFAKELSSNDVMVHNKPKFHVQTTKGRPSKVNIKDIGYNTQVHLTVQENYKVFKENETAVNNLNNRKQSWVEGKWATDFIDNVFKKIKSGVYYSQDENCLSRRYATRIKDDSSQTDNYLPKWNYDQRNDLDLITDKKLIHDSLMLIPGFDNTSNNLEIESFSKTQIAVKNCVTNVVVQFDVELPSDPCAALHLKQSFSCIPIAATESQTTIFKSKTTIINAFLPAELCSILPMMMRGIIASNTKISLPKLTVGKIESRLSIISELTRCENPETSKLICHEISKPRTPDMLLNIKSIRLFDSIVKPMILPDIIRNEPEIIQINNSINNLNKECCMVLQIYQPLNKIIPAYKPFNLEHYIENLINIKHFEINCYNNGIAISVRFQNDLSNINVKLKFSNDSIDSLCNHSYDSLCDNYKNSIEYDKSIACSSNNSENGLKDMYAVKSTPSVVAEKRRNGSEFKLNNSKTKKKSYARLYKKCNSMSNLSNNRSNASIDKITNTDEFVQALGSSKILSAVIDGNTERKILLSLKEMKSWMTDITPRQALLVLLLANKKDTPNIVRYRPVVLQGIAVNRITRASELDMEIEVIERENLNKLKQFEGISYLPASVENQDTLLEELYWIAKTTASDYQKPFDEASERLLKSLLEKRKTLNPSYLRVMARYVGLGLLKSSK